jgi:DNA-binding NtrC family response regulator
MHRILIVEDNPVDQRLFEQALSDPTREIEICSDGREALAAFERRAADVVISDIMMPNMEGNELLTELHRRVPGLPIILVTRFGSISAAVTAMQAGAFDYVTKPVEVFELQTRVRRALELDQLHHENDTLRQELAGRFGPDSVVAESIESRKLMELVRRIAASHSTVLIQGESGTGKELVARLVHYCSDRVGHPFVAVNCKAFAESVLESELFGQARTVHRGTRPWRAAQRTADPAARPAPCPCRSRPGSAPWSGWPLSVAPVPSACGSRYFRRPPSRGRSARRVPGAECHFRDEAGRARAPASPGSVTRTPPPAW